MKIFGSQSLITDILFCSDGRVQVMKNIIMIDNIIEISPCRKMYFSIELENNNT